MKLPFYARLFLVVLLALALAEVVPEFVNALLILILVGIVLGHYQQFSFLARVLGTVSTGD